MASSYRRDRLLTMALTTSVAFAKIKQAANRIDFPAVFLFDYGG
jgi:hypothetical protein